MNAYAKYGRHLDQNPYTKCITCGWRADMGHSKNCSVMAANNAAKEQAETFSKDFPGVRAWMYDSEHGPQIQADNGKDYGNGLVIYYQGPAGDDFDKFAYAFSYGWEACESFIAEGS